jgi:endonuclease III
MISGSLLIARLHEQWPDASCELYAREPWQLLVAAILSARVSDVRVNQVMAVLDEHVGGIERYAGLHPSQLEPYLRRLPLHGQKARAIVECARVLLAYHDGLVPQDRDQLQTLPGVGPKVAAVVQGNAFGIPAVAADGHVQRILRRIGWCEQEEPQGAEQAIIQHVEPQHWVRLCHQLIRLGRTVCRPRRPRCAVCPIGSECPRCGVESLAG